MLDNEKIGLFLKELRTRNNMSQQELADKMYVTRQAISLWETGKNLPDIEKVNELANLYNVTIADIYAGEILKDKSEGNKIVSQVIKHEQNKAKRILKILISITVLFIVLFLIYFFFTYYKNVSVYTIASDEDKYKINGIITKSVNQVYFNLETDENVDRICLIYKDNDINKEILCREDSNFLVFKDLFGYKEYLPDTNFDNFINNLYLHINEDEIKLMVKQDYQNDKLVISNDDEIDDGEIIDINNNNIPNKIRKKFKYDSESNLYILKQNNKTLSFNIDNNEFTVHEKDGDINKEWRYNLTINQLILYVELNLKENKTIVEYKDFTKMDTNQKKIYDYFIKNYKEKYLD